MIKTIVFELKSFDGIKNEHTTHNQKSNNMRQTEVYQSQRPIYNY